MSPSSTHSSVIHSVHFYDQDEALIQRLSNIISSAIDTGNASVVVATEAHRTQLLAALQSRNGDLRDVQEDGRLSLFDARETLTKFMVNGMLNEQRFSATLNQLLEKARSASWNTQCGLTVFGEMVAVLWQDGNTDGALRLEELWNDLLNRHAFHLHCAYPRALFDDRSQIRAVCEQHSHVVGQAA